MLVVLLAALVRVTSPGPGPLTLVDGAPLPVYAETAAWAVPFGDELRLFINRPGRRGDTAQLRVTAALHVSELPAVPMIAAGACACARQLVLTGADTDGHPVAAIVAADGKVVRRIAFKAASAAFPLPGCLLSRPVVLSHDSPRRLAIHEVGAAGSRPARLVDVGDDSLQVASVSGGLVAAWAEPYGISGVEIAEAEGDRLPHPRCPAAVDRARRVRRPALRRLDRRDLGGLPGQAHARPQDIAAVAVEPGRS
jgi:hypothetical protein